MARKKVTAQDASLVVDTTTAPVQTTIDWYIEQTIENNLPEEKKFVQALSISKNFADPLSNISLQSIRIAGLFWGTVKTYKENYFTPAFVKKWKGQDAEELAFYSDQDIKTNWGLTGKQKAYAYLEWIAKEYISSKKEEEQSMQAA